MPRTERAASVQSASEMHGCRDAYTSDRASVAWCSSDAVWIACLSYGDPLALTGISLPPRSQQLAAAAMGTERMSSCRKNIFRRVDVAMVLCAALDAGPLLPDPSSLCAFCCNYRPGLNTLHRPRQTSRRRDRPCTESERRAPEGLLPAQPAILACFRRSAYSLQTAWTGGMSGLALPPLLVNGWESEAERNRRSRSHIFNKSSLQ